MAKTSTYSTRGRIAITLCKACRRLMRATGHGGTSLPGRVAQRVCPDILDQLTAPYRVIIVSGTNGKTTTCRLISHALEKNGEDVLANRSGANLVGGIVAEFADAANTKAAKAEGDGASSPSASSAEKRPVAIIECDEAALRRVLDHVQPEIIVLTNVFRDQLDRYGEVTHTRDLLHEAVTKAPGATLCLNADDSLIASVAGDVPNKVLFYGIDEVLGENDTIDTVSDAMYCIYCGHKYTYGYHTYGHLGQFRCEACGYARPATHVGATVTAQNDQTTDIDLRLPTHTEQRTVPLPALFNTYNYLAAATALTAFGAPLPDDDATADVSAFGRMEHFDLGAGVTMILVKNPAGFSQVVDYLVHQTAEYDLLVCLNDNYADGTDISWIWDVPLERLAQAPLPPVQCYVGGTRKEDMALRLKYAGLPESRTELVLHTEQFVRDIASRTRPLIIVPTYTAMMEIRRLLAHMVGGQDFWE